MSDSPSSNNFLYLIVGVLVAAAVAFGIYYFTEGAGGPQGVEISVGEDGVKIDEN
jgi:hypothetical protein